MKQNFLCQAEQSVLLIIDIQERLASAMERSIVEQIQNNSKKLVEAAKLLNIPVIVSEQYPQGLGSTVPALQTILASAQKVEKTQFSCCGTADFYQKLGERNQVIIAGMETHICVLQTALELQANNMQVFVVEDAVCSRTLQNKNNALHRMRQAGVMASNVESVLFEWLQNAQHEHFKAIQSLIK